MKVYVVLSHDGDETYAKWTDSIWTEEISADERVRQLDTLNKLIPMYTRTYSEVETWEVDTVE